MLEFGPGLFLFVRSGERPRFVHLDEYFFCVRVDEISESVAFPDCRPDINPWFCFFGRSSGIGPISAITFLEDR